jgi:cytochrome c oxidase assembly protein subunit 11
MQPDRWLPAKLAVLAIGMFAFGFALAPLYSVLCSLVGVGNQTLQSAAAAAVVDPDPSRTVTVEFTTVANTGQPWVFEPRAPSMQVHPGQLSTATFYAENLTAHAIVAQAVPSITPGYAAQFFHKTECFCFTPQSFGPGEGRDMLVRFIVDRALPKHVQTMTLAYRFFDITEAAAASARATGR